MRSTITLAAATLALFELANLSAYTRGAAPLGFTTAVACALAVAALVWHLRPSLPALPARALPPLPLLAGAYAIATRDLFRPGPFLGFGIAAVLGLLAVSAAAFVPRRPVRLALVVGGALLTGTVLRAFEFLFVPVHPRVADMLPLVVVALRELSQGLPPYRMYHLPWDVPLTYLPLSWLAYGPLWAAGFDLRWTNTAAEIAVLGAVAFAGRKRREKTFVDSAIVLWAVWFVGHPTITADGQVAAAVQWAVLAWLTALALEMHAATPLALGFALATTTLAIPLVPTLAVAWTRGRQHPGSPRPRRRLGAVGAAAIVGVVALVMVVPWWLASPQGFLEGVVLWFNDLGGFPRSKWLENRAWAAHAGFAGILWTFGLERFAKAVQLAVLGVFAWRFARRLREVPVRKVVGSELVASLIAFLVFNPVIWGYLCYAPVAMLLVVLGGARGRESWTLTAAKQATARKGPAHDRSGATENRVSSVASSS